MTDDLYSGFWNGNSGGGGGETKIPPLRFAQGWTDRSESGGIINHQEVGMGAGQGDEKEKQ